MCAQLFVILSFFHYSSGKLDFLFENKTHEWDISTHYLALGLNKQELH